MTWIYRYPYEVSARQKVSFPFQQHKNSPRQRAMPQLTHFFLKSYFSRDVFLEIRFCAILQDIQNGFGPRSPKISSGALKNQIKTLMCILFCICICICVFVLDIMQEQCLFIWIYYCAIFQISQTPLLVQVYLRHCWQFVYRRRLFPQDSRYNRKRKPATSP